MKAKMSLSSTSGLLLGYWTTGPMLAKSQGLAVFWWWLIAPIKNVKLGVDQVLCALSGFVLDALRVSHRDVHRSICVRLSWKNETPHCTTNEKHQDAADFAFTFCWSFFALNLRFSHECELPEILMWKPKCSHATPPRINLASWMFFSSGYLMTDGMEKSAHSPVSWWCTSGFTSRNGKCPFQFQGHLATIFPFFQGANCIQGGGLDAVPFLRRSAATGHDGARRSARGQKLGAAAGCGCLGRWKLGDCGGIDFVKLDGHS